MFRILSTHLRPLVGAPTRCAYQQAVGNSVVSHPPISKQFVQMMSYDSSNKTHNKIHSLISKSNKGVFVFMKGVPKEPSCRYSAIVVQILDAYGVDYDSSDVLEDPDIRQEIKTYSDWPTIPQVYKDGQFIGGCDILLQMHQSGELKQLFGDDPKSKSDQKA